MTDVILMPLGKTKMKVSEKLGGKCGFFPMVFVNKAKNISDKHIQKCINGPTN